MIAATPNHPVYVNGIKKVMGEVVVGDHIVCAGINNKTTAYTVFNTTESAGGFQKVYNMEVNAGSTFIMNGVMVSQK